MMLRYQHIMASRVVGGLAFSVALIMTPRAWVEEDSPEEVRIETLSLQSDCEPTVERPRVWLNPDEVPLNIECAPPLDPHRPAS